MLLELADVARGAGLRVVEVPGWRERGHPGGMTDVRAVVLHHTAGPAAGDAPSLAVVRDGRPDLAGPLAHIVLARSGTVHVVAAGLCWHTGATLERWQGNAYAIGIEAEHTGKVGDPWPPAQLAALRTLCRALMARYEVPAERVVGHREIAVFPPGHPRAGQLGRKPDLAGIDHDAFRASLEKEDAVPTADEIAAAVWRARLGNSFGDVVEARQILDGTEKRVVDLQAAVAALRADVAALRDAR